MSNETEIDAIPEHVFAAVSRSTRFQILALINRVVAKSGITSDEVATRLGWPRRRVERFWRGQIKLTINNISSMLFAIDGSILTASSQPIDA